MAYAQLLTMILPFLLITTVLLILFIVNFRKADPEIRKYRLWAIAIVAGIRYVIWFFGKFGEDVGSSARFLTSFIAVSVDALFYGLIASFIVGFLVKGPPGLGKQKEQEKKESTDKG